MWLRLSFETATDPIQTWKQRLRFSIRYLLIIVLLIATICGWMVHVRQLNARLKAESDKANHAEQELLDVIQLHEQMGMPFPLPPKTRSRVPALYDPDDGLYFSRQNTLESFLDDLDWYRYEGDYVCYRFRGSSGLLTQVVLEIDGEEPKVLLELNAPRIPEETPREGWIALWFPRLKLNSDNKWNYTVRLAHNRYGVTKQTLDLSEHLPEWAVDIPPHGLKGIPQCFRQNFKLKDDQSCYLIGTGIWLEGKPEIRIDFKVSAVRAQSK